ncbi:ABC transporter ATP-binding protein [Natrialba sp. SSL1]|uniref:ABC transporter ATP-binding protein n=1 Tax=Natrialba sp. SSL1 TaxID=1869245 RepID=UPI0008F81F60|nr:ABC transporter ATP-binding protein [Natrialba sp. SSL1]OIB58953.1 Fe3+/spermidine/putrescine ABC transporter ATP-binding protein [Natrialba sp. SSL1]
MLEITNLTKYYGDHLAVEDLSFSIEEGDFATLLGPSGCGKSTTLRTIAGLIEPTEGTITLRGEDVTNLPPDQRNIGMVFQSSALFPHMTVKENLAYGLKMHGLDDEVDTRVSEYLDLVEMSGYEDHKTTELSGGQQRRVSIARALAYEPDILLLDEPLTGLDRVLREQIRNEIKQIQREINVTTLFVTHDQQEALSLSNQIIVLNNGQKEQEGTPESLYEHPKNRFVAEFVGKSSRFTGQPDDTKPSVIQNGSLTFAVDPESIPDTSPNTDGADVTLYVRPEDVVIDTSSTFQNEFDATVSHIADVGSHSEIELELEDGTPVLVEAERFPDLSVGEQTTVGFDPEDVIVL